MKRITEYNNITSIAESDVLPIVDVSDTSQASTGSTRKGTIGKIADYLKARTETLSNKTIDSSVNVVEVLKKVYPVGCIYTSTVSTNPNTLFGFGTWSAFGSGKALVGVDIGDTDFNSVEKTGGEKTHTLTVAEIPSHTHNTAEACSNSGGIPDTNSGYGYEEVALNTSSYGHDLSYTGGGGSHNNLQPYIVFNYIIKT